MKKIISIFIIIAVISSSCIVTLAFNANNDLTVQSEYEENYKLLNGICIFSEDMSKNVFDDIVTRKIGFKYLSELLGLKYDDTKAVENAVNYKFIASANDYRPDSKLSINDATRAIINVLGYASHAESKGGYPSGYTAVASKLDIFNGVDTSKLYLSYSDFYKMLVNSLDVEVQSISKITESGMYTVSGTDENILEYYFDYKVPEGIITENNISTLYIPANNSEGTLVINEKKYKAKDNKYAYLLGHNVKLYVNQNDVVLYAITSDSNELVIEDKDFDSCSAGKVKYENEKNKLVTKKLDTNHHVIYNGVAYTGYTNKDLNEFSGEMILIDNDNDGEYEIVKVNNYSTGIVQSINVFEKTITMKYPAGKVYNYSDMDDSSIFVYSDEGERTTFAYILDDDVISVLESKTLNNVTINVSRKSATGIVDSINDDTVTVDGVDYYITDDVLNEFKNITPGSSVKFGLDFKGRFAAAFDVDNEYMRYGYIIQAREPADMRDNGKIKILDQDGSIQLYSIADRVRIDDNYADEKQFIAKLTHNGTNPISQVVKYKLTDDKIRVIDTIDGANTSITNDIKSSVYTSVPFNTYRRVASTPGQPYGTLGSIALVHEDNTFVFDVPKLLTSEPDFAFPDNMYNVYTSYASDNAKCIKNNGDVIELVDMDEFKIPKAIVYYNNISKESILNPVIGNGASLNQPDGNKSPVVISKIADAINENGDAIKRVYITKSEHRSSAIFSNLSNYISFDLDIEDENLLWKNVYDNDGNVISGEHTLMEPGDIVQFQKYRDKLNGSYVVYDTNLTPIQNAKRMKAYSSYGNSCGFAIGVPYSISLEGFSKVCTKYDTDTDSINISDESAKMFILPNNVITVNLEDGKSSVETLNAVKSYESFGDDHGYCLIVSYTGIVYTVFCIK